MDTVRGILYGGYCTGKSEEDAMLKSGKKSFEINGEKNAVLLLSGGMDSTTVLALLRQQGRSVHALSFDYGQRHAVELSYARDVAQHYQVAEHIIYPLDLRVFGHSALTADIPVPKQRQTARSSPTTMGQDRDKNRGKGRDKGRDMDIGQGRDKGRDMDIPITYVPARNMIFLSLALAYAETREIRDIFIGVNHIDYSGYPDCRPEFLDAWQKSANLATRRGVHNDSTPAFQVQAPLLDMSKVDILRLGMELGVDYARTISCYDPMADGTVCGECDACVLRQKAFARVKIADPAQTSPGASSEQTSPGQSS